MTSALAHLSEAPWSNYSAADYSIEQWHTACLIHLHQGAPTSKNQCKLPVRTPDGTVNRNGVHAAAAALAGARGGVKAPVTQIASAKAALKRLYGQLSETPPPSLQQSAILTARSDEEPLEHHGVKGMKWGVRNDRGHEGQRVKTKKIAKLDKKWEKNAYSTKTFIALHNRAAELSNAHDIDRINNKPQYKNADFTNDSPLRRQYYNEHQQAFVSNVRKAAAELGTNPSGTRKIEITTDKNGDWMWRTNDVKHADTTIDPFDLLDGSVIQVFYDNAGHITRIEPPTSDLQQSDIGDIMTDEETLDFLVHFGVRGMKWGVRKNSSSHTPAAGDAPEHIRARQLHDTAKKHGTRKLTNKDLEDLNKRLNLEQNYSKLTSSGGSSNKARQEGGKFITGVLRNVGQQIASEILKGHAMAFVKKKGLTATT